MSGQLRYVQRLAGASVLIIGGSSGVGFGVAEASIEHGMTVHISSSDTSRIAAKVDQLKRSYPAARVSGHVCDLGTIDTLEVNVKKLFGSVGNVDHIVYTAGDALAGVDIRQLDVATITKLGTVRFYAPLLVAKYALQHLTPTPSSSITLTTGAVAARPIPDWSVLGAFAAGLHGMVRGLALDLKPIRVNLVSLGAVDTEFWKMPAEDKQKIFRMREGKSLTGKIGRVEDVAQSYVYLMTDQNITGTVVSTDSGMLLL
ncbi:uncharacterized protein PV07_07616 [Cladophialophora immunda]|uniref:Uncharacterized protein n=1 Tax=Cladophialophora immunda TaxID=569365 RepID=A0A0D1ZIX3_9EURO|nr:uncharacterized protein PV07_07616 [Cladophialophora immunda]KIW27921.1 hypothetical protein PV07_07616 [Cladophialophora immunda]